MIFLYIFPKVLSLVNEEESVTHKVEGKTGKKYLNIKSGCAGMRE